MRAEVTLRASTVLTVWEWPRRIVSRRAALAIINLALVLAVIAGVSAGSSSSVLMALPLALLVIAGLARFGLTVGLGVSLVLLPLVPTSVHLSVVGIGSTETILGVLVVCLMMRSRRPPRKSTVWVPTRLSFGDRCAGLLVAWLTLSFILGGTADRDIRVFLDDTVFPATMYLAGRIVLSEPRGARWLGVAATGAAAAAVGIWIESYAGRPVFAGEDNYLSSWITEGFRPGSMLQGPNFASAYLALGLAAALPLTRIHGGLRTWGILATLIIPTTLLATQSVSGLIEMAVVFGGTLATNGNRLIRIGLALAALVVGLEVVTGAPNIATLFPAHAVSIEGRYDLLATASAASAELTRDAATVVVGIGYNHWSQLENEFAVGTIQNVGRTQSLHNTYLTLLFESGAPAALLFVALLLAALRQGWRQRARPTAMAGSLAALSAIAICGAGTITVIPQVSGILLFLIAGAMSSGNEIDNQNSGLLAARALSAGT